MRLRDGSAAACHLARVLPLALTNLKEGRVVIDPHRGRARHITDIDRD
jgi:hypothetical protein